MAVPWLHVVGLQSTVRESNNVQSSVSQAYSSVNPSPPYPHPRPLPPLPPSCDGDEGGGGDEGDEGDGK